MVAGLNCEVEVWRINYAADDPVGGAVTTGTTLYATMDAHLQAQKPDPLLVQQGLEVMETFDLLCRPGNYVVKGRDEIRVKRPVNHPYYNKWFRVNGPSEVGFHPSDGRGYLLLTLTRSVEAHANQ